MMERQLQQLVRLIDDLLDVSRITRGKLQLRKERTDLAAVLNDAVETARPVLLEPIMDVTIEVPARFMGDISGDLNSRRGRIVGMDQDGDVSIIRAQVPQAEMLNYSTELRSITAGEGDFSFAFAHYEVVPSHIASEIVARHKKELEAAHA